MAPTVTRPATGTHPSPDRAEVHPPAFPRSRQHLEAQHPLLAIDRDPIWEKEISEFPWTYDATEVAYVLEGEVTVTPAGGEPVHIVAGDLVALPAGMQCHWRISVPIRKHYSFEFPDGF